jgi:nucleotidyltransferase substrate binding protein (TIGR01987 family)
MNLLLSLAWKTLKVLFEDEGLIGLNSPETVLKEALGAGLITNEELWLKMLADRNSTTHIYNEQLAIEICSQIRQSYVTVLERLAGQVEKRMQ